MARACLSPPPKILYGKPSGRRTDKLAWGRKIALPGPGGKGDSHPGGLALSADEKRAYVCLSRNNSLGIVDLESGTLTKELPVGIAPFDVALMADGKTAFVSNWGGRHPKSGEKTAKSSGTDTLVDDRTVAASGTVSVVDLDQGQEIAQITTGLHPSDLELSADQRTLYVANANSDTVSVIDTTNLRVVESVLVRPDPTLPFGSAPNALTLGKDGKTLFVANGGNNAVAVVALAAGSRNSKDSFPPLGIRARSSTTAISCTLPTSRGWDRGNPVKGKQGLEQPSVSRHGEQGEDSHRADSAGLHPAGQGGRPRAADVAGLGKERFAASKPVPVPRRLGEPSVFEHVVYIIKENRTYDQVFGDLPQGNADPALCVFGREVTPNHHALAEAICPAGQLLLQRRPLRRRSRLGHGGLRHGLSGEVFWRVHPQLSVRRR